MNHSHSCPAVRASPDTADLCFNRTLEFLQFIQTSGRIAADGPVVPRIPLVICFPKQKMNRNGTRIGVGNFSKEETMHMLRIVERVLPIGSEGWKAVEAEHADEYPARCKNALMRKYATLYRKPIPTGDPNCPEEVKLAKRIKYMIGNKAAIGNAEEEFNLEEIEFGESGANPNPDANNETDAEEAKEEDDNTPPVAATETASSSLTTAKKRTYRKLTEER